MSKIKFAWQSSKPFSFSQYILLGILVLLIGLGTIPGYFSGRWAWTQVPDVPNIRFLKNLSKTGLTLPDFQETAQQQFLIGNRRWSAQELQHSGESLILLLMPQDYSKNTPQTEWSDLKSLEKWRTNSTYTSSVPIQVNSSHYSVTARYFKAWTQTTFVIVQWYAWPGGGSFAVSDWFWQAQWSQLRQRPLPWVAVNLKIPIEPTQDLKTMLPKINTFVQAVQTNLEKNVFTQLQPPTDLAK